MFGGVPCLVAGFRRAFPGDKALKRILNPLDRLAQGAHLVASMGA